ncbi:hypothetical protein E4A48_18620 [Xanthomonas cerealis pv. cerealis]|uniref:Uncharacterized protein n=1 Tax=Xanthomonas cerealis pv. cerealis TaxID=152263 RepID=A0A514EHA2_9XANT|nr:hypothetical protein [Xanthomonas translucens]QDI05419.1 hypothetical protein E4A48_18620 [Xanthomonas translucens pv. cerealis]
MQAHSSSGIPASEFVAPVAINKRNDKFGKSIEIMGKGATGNGVTGYEFSSSHRMKLCQCPTEFGPKHPIVNLLGWPVVALGGGVGGLRFAYLVRRLRGMRWLSRAAAIVLGFCGMIAVCMGGLALACVYFFFPCWACVQAGRSRRARVDGPGVDGHGNDLHSSLALHFAVRIVRTL